MSLSLKLSQMKKIKADKDFTTMSTPEGHLVHIAHNAISKPHRKALEMLPFADGGEVYDPDRADALAKKAQSEREQESKQRHSKEKAKREQDVEDAKHYSSPGPEVETQEKKHEPPTVAEKIDLPTGPSLADGGEVANKDTPDTSEDSGESIPIASSPDQAAVNSAPPTETLDQAQSVEGAQPSPGLQGVQDQLTQLQTQRSPASEDNSQEQPINTEPSVSEGYKNQVQGALNQADAEQSQIDAKANAIKSNIEAQQKVFNDYQQAHDHTMAELQNIRKDINDFHVDPNHYMGSKDTLGKIGTAIGLVLGGIAGGGKGNQVLDFVNNQINRDIEAQKSELGKKESIYNALLQQDMSHERATNMSRLILNDMAVNKLQNAEMSTANPIVKARAQQAIGALQTQMAPMIRQENMYKMLNNGSSDALKNTDPASLVPFVVPPDKQKDVFHEISQAQNASKTKQAFLQAFDKAAQENTILGRAERLGFTPPSIKAMEMLSLPLVHDLEGRVNEYEQKTVQDNMPKPGDLPDTVARKREAIEHFFDQKSAAPTAKGFGIDLNKFNSTSTNTPTVKTMNGVKYQKVPGGWARIK